MTKKINVFYNTGLPCGRYRYLKSLCDLQGLDATFHSCNEVSKKSFAMGALFNNLLSNFNSHTLVANNTAILVCNSIISLHDLPFYSKYESLRFLYLIENIFLLMNKGIIVNSPWLKKSLIDCLPIFKRHLEKKIKVVFPDIVLIEHQIQTKNIVKTRGKNEVIIFSRIIKTKRIVEQVELLTSEGFTVTVAGRLQDNDIAHQLKDRGVETYFNLGQNDLYKLVSTFYWSTIGYFDEPYGITISEAIRLGALPIRLAKPRPRLHFDLTHVNDAIFRDLVTMNDNDHTKLVDLYNCELDDRQNSYEVLDL